MKTFTLNKSVLISTRLILASLFVFTAVQCSKDSPDEIHEHETINRVTLTVTGADGTATDYTWNEGETEPTINLSANTTHRVSISFFDASDASDVENITEEVIEEADEHFVFYEVSSASLNISSASNDVQDSDGIDININTEWAAAGASSGVVRTYLIHGPTSKTGSTRSSFGGGTDIELNFPVAIQ